MQRRRTRFARWFGTALVIAGLLAAAVPASAANEDETGFEAIFDGETLDGWDGNPKFWRVEDGVLTGQTTADNPTSGNTFIIWRGGQVGDFELRLEYKIVGGNSGVQYRSFEVENEKWVVGGYQADIDSGDTYSGINYGERYRGILCPRGEKTVIRENGKPEKVGEIGDSKELQSKVKKEDWNTYRIVAKGYHFTHEINGQLMSECTDEDTDVRRKDGILALQLHAGPPMKVQFRNIHLRRLDDGEQASAKGAGSGKKKVVLIAGRASHGFGEHEHKAGCLLLAEQLVQSGLPVQIEVVTNGWPKDASVLQDADTIVIYSDGGGGHPFNAHLDELRELFGRGVGMVAIHYGVEVPKGKSGEAFLDWIGGYFEPHWSVNPHWTADYDKLPDHPIARGVRPFTIRDEWYYHMRFPESMDRVTPILTDLPPKETLNRPDGPHSGNPDVRTAVLERREPQHTAWAYERPDGGRGFGFTGGHFHWNWGNDQFRKLVLNAIVWTAGLDVPEDGVPVQPVTVDDLLANQDDPVPGDFNKARMEAQLAEWNRAGSVAK